ncbi:cytochrome P450 [[Phormidium ambiguum] IAM M-71]|uniref:Cytochrome P450 n=1 Tax=[Phormidium ambiguum] IAM M-71 TaxID=454136 RepID=A0A1U7ILH7_9CYAN|nr:cytochrome P450 [Phormidium ambiguum]OKH38111.1 cytochrome P450 [Phormidium ambiguum IAM M-71]
MKQLQGPQSPTFVQTLQWIFRPMQYMEECAKRYGDIFTIQLGAEFDPLVYVSNPKALQQILTNDTTKPFTAPGDINKIFEPLTGKLSIFGLSGKQHQRQRQLMMPPFHGDRMLTYANTIAEVTEKIMSRWQVGESFCARTSTQAITLRVIMQAVFGLYDGPRAQQLEKVLGEMIDEASSPLSVTMIYFPFLQKDLGAWSPWGKYLRRKAQVDQLIYDEIRERRANFDPSRTDILNLLMEARDEAGEGMTDEELHDELMALLLAGHETTATALAWALYWIHQIPEVRSKLLAELDTLGENPDPNAIFKLPYLNAVCCETLRIYPVAMLTFPRVVQEPVNLAGYALQPGTVLLGSIYLTHQREDLYPEPKKFKPERFLERQFSPYEFLPFGAGARRCIGFAFAQFEMKMVLAKMLSRFDLQLVDNNEIKPVRRGLVTAPNRSIQLLVKGKSRIKSRTVEAVAN